MGLMLVGVFKNESECMVVDDWGRKGRKDV